MEDSIFKRFIYNSIGFASLATKRMEELINDLLSQGKVSEEEGKKIMENFNSTTTRAKDDLEKDMKSLIEQMIRKMDVAHKRDLESLEARVTALENIHNKERGGGTPGAGPINRPAGDMPPQSKPHGDPNQSDASGPMNRPGQDNPGPRNPNEPFRNTDAGKKPDNH